MPRRNRNAHAFTIDADELAARAAQLTTELGTVNGVTLHLVDEMQFFYIVSASGAGKSAFWCDHFREWFKENPYNVISLIDGKAVTGNVRK